MSIKNLEEAFDLIEKNKDKGFFSGAKSEELIVVAEQALALSLPTTYRLFLKKYGSGGIGESDVYGLTIKSAAGFVTPGGLDGIWLTLDRRKMDEFPKHFIIISDSGDGCWYCLDTSQVNSDGEYPVVIWRFGMPEEKKEKVAEDFGEFLLEQTKQALED